MREQFKSILNNMLHFVYPHLCEGCGTTLMSQESLLCIECVNLLPFTNYHHIAGNESEQRFAGRIQFERASSLCYFTKESLLQHLLHEFKYNGNEKVGIFFGQKLGNAIGQTSWASSIDMIVPVPLHIQKSKLRGFNQSEIVAVELGKTISVAVCSANLIRNRNTDSQIHKTREERAENMAGAFTVKDRKVFEGKHLLLLDDVLTTGATLEGCVLALQKIRGLKVSMVTLGIAGS